MQTAARLSGFRFISSATAGEQIQQAKDATVSRRTKARTTVSLLAITADSELSADPSVNH